MRTLLIVMVGLALCLLLSTNSLAATLVVTSNDDDGPGSLREAIAIAAGGDVIEFAMTGVIGLTSLESHSPASR